MQKFVFLIMVSIIIGCGKESSSIKQDYTPNHQGNERLESKQDADGDGIEDSQDQQPFIADIPVITSFENRELSISIIRRGLESKNLLLESSLSYTNKLEPELLSSLGDTFPKNYNLWDLGPGFFIAFGPGNESMHQALKQIQDIESAQIDSLEFLFSSFIRFELSNISTIKDVQLMALMVDMVNGEINELEKIKVKQEFSSLKGNWVNLGFRLEKSNLKGVLERIIKGEIRFAFGLADCVIENGRDTCSGLVGNVKKKSMELSGNYLHEFESRFISSDKVETVEQALNYILDPGSSVVSTITWRNGGEISVDTFHGKKTFYYILKTENNNGGRTKIFPGDRILFLEKKSLASKVLIVNHGKYEGNSKVVFTNGINSEEGVAEVYLSDLSFKGFKLGREEFVRSENFCKVSGKVQAGMVISKKFNYKEVGLNLDDKSTIDYFLEHVFLVYDDEEIQLKTEGFPLYFGSYQLIKGGLVIKVPVDGSPGILRKIIIRGGDKTVDTSDSGVACHCPNSGYIDCPVDIINNGKKESMRFTDFFKFSFTSIF